MLDEMIKQNASIFVIFLEYVNFSFHAATLFNLKKISSSYVECLKCYIKTKNPGKIRN